MIISKLKNSEHKLHFSKSVNEHIKIIKYYLKYVHVNANMTALCSRTTGNRSKKQ